MPDIDVVVFIIYRRVRVGSRKNRQHVSTAIAVFSQFKGSQHKAFLSDLFLAFLLAQFDTLYLAFFVFLDKYPLHPASSV